MKFKNSALKIKAWRHNPVQFVQDNFGVIPDAWQADALMAIAGYGEPRRRLVLKASTGVGKSTVMAWIGWHRLSCFGSRGEFPKGAAISGEGAANLSDNLWSELAKWRTRSEYLNRAFTWTESQIYANGHESTWFLSARSFPKDADAEQIGQSLSGLHSNYPFILLDEIGGAPPVLSQRAEQIFTGGVLDGLIAMAGNPTDTSGLLYTACVHAKDTKIITITSDPLDPKRSSRVDPAHAQAMIDRYGRDNSWVKSTILGEFPDAASNSLLSLSDVQAAMTRVLNEDAYINSQKRIGCDVARFGSDSTILAPRQGLRAFNPVEMRGARTNDIAARVMAAKVRWGSEMEFVDGSGGYGGGVVDSLMQAGYSPVEVNFSGKPISSKYLNARAEMWILMCEWIKRGAKLPNDPSLIKQFVTPTYTFRNGKFALESKDEIKKRLGYSPDYADALALTFYHPEMPAQLVGRPGVPDWVRKEIDEKNYVSEWDPWDVSREP